MKKNRDSSFLKKVLNHSGHLELKRLAVINVNYNIDVYKCDRSREIQLFQNQIERFTVVGLEL